MKRQQTRQLIIETASDLFYERGYNLVGINEIIEAAGIAKATLYSHFKSKEDLCLAYLNYRDEGLIQELSAFSANRPKGPDRVMAILDFLLQFFNQDGFNGCWCLRTVAEVPRDNVRIKGTIQKQKKALLELIQKIVVENLPELSSAQQKELAQQVYMLYEGALSASHLHEHSWPIDTNIQLLQKLLN